MKTLIALAFAVTALSIATPTFAVDNSISALCRADHAGSTYQRPGGFCDAVANPRLSNSSGGPSTCPAGTEHNPTPPPACIPEV